MTRRKLAIVVSLSSRSMMWFTTFSHGQSEAPIGFSKHGESIKLKGVRLVEV
jgi:hypothetical protein